MTVGGGFGLFLKRRHLDESGARTLFRELPEVRTTNDIDMFLRAEVLADFARTSEVASAVARLGYEVVEAAKYLQWKKPVRVGDVEQEVKLDVLVGPLGDLKKKMKVKPPRARPKNDIKFHAHMVEEAHRIEEDPFSVEVSGRASDGNEYRGRVFVPEAFPYLLMKLHAFADRKNEADKDLGRHHALDVYTIVGMMTETEYERARALGKTDAGAEPVRKARQIVAADFSSRTAEGILRMREHALFRATFDLDEFILVLGDVFGREGDAA